METGEAETSVHALHKGWRDKGMAVYSPVKGEDCVIDAFVGMDVAESITCIRCRMWRIQCG